MAKVATVDGLYFQGSVAEFRKQLAEWSSFPGGLLDYLHQHLH